MSDEPPTRRESAETHLETVGAGHGRGPAQSDSEIAALHSGAAVGRYLLLRKLDRGPGKLVYLAYDPELDRRVSLELLDTGASPAGSRGRTRLVREAQALAKLSHPQVVQVYDVGTWKEQVYVAMEVVDGASLRDWVRTESPSPREIIEVIASAGRGLAAAHAAGVLHLDVKPTNVMVTGERDVRLIDFAFGPERNAAVDPDPGAEVRASISSLARPDFGGSPGYRAPEVMDGILGTSADQFSLAVTAWECLFGARPFPGATHKDVAAATKRARPHEPSAATRPPAHIRQAIERALSADPALRFPEVLQFVETLERIPVRRTQRSVAVLLALAICGAAGASLWLSNSATDPCAKAPAEMENVWEASQASALRAAFRDTGLPYAKTVAASVVRKLDQHAKDWSAARVQTCEATQVHAEQSTSMLERRNACLDIQLAEIEAVVQRLAAADAAMVRRGLQALEGLTPASECDAARVLGRRPPPDDPATREQVRALGLALARASALSRTGGVREGLEEAKRVHRQATSLGHLPLVASAAHLVGFLHTEMGRPDEAAKSYGEALDAADASGMDVLRAETLLNLLWVAGHDRSNARVADRYAAHARAVIRRVGAPPELRAHLATNMAVVHARQGRFEEAIAGCNDALAILAAAPELTTNESGVASLHNNLGGFYYESGQLPEALEEYERAIDLRSEQLGPEHPLVASLLGNIGNVRQAMGETERALVAQDRGIEILRRAVDPNSVDLAHALNNRAVTLSQLHRYDDAANDYANAISIYRTVDDVDPRVGVAQMNFAELRILQGRSEEAVERSADAIRVLEKSLGPDHPHLGYAKLNRGWALLEAGRAGDSIVPLRNAKQTLDAKVHDPAISAQADFLLGRALIESGDAGEGPRLINAARPQLRLDPDWKARVDAWDEGQADAGAPRRERD